MEPVPLTEQPEMHHLPRLAPELYRGLPSSIGPSPSNTATGWLDASFHHQFRELLLHAAAREGLFCPVYVLMPDHLHLVWLGLRVDSDQRNAMKFLRKHLAVELTRRGAFELQKQSHDSVLREKDRERGAFHRAPSRTPASRQPAAIKSRREVCGGFGKLQEIAGRHIGEQRRPAHEVGGSFHHVVDAVQALQCELKHPVVSGR